MSIRIICPSCKAGLRVADGAKQVRCPKCTKFLLVPQPTGKAEKQKGIQTGQQLKSGDRPKATDTKAQPPRPSKKEKPAKRGSPVFLLAVVGGIGALLLLLIGGGFAGWYYWPTKEPPQVRLDDEKSKKEKDKDKEGDHKKDPDPAILKDPEKLFRAMENNLVAAKTIKVRMEGTMEFGFKMTSKTTAVLGEGNQVQIESSTSDGKHTTKSYFVSDGAQMLWDRFDGKPAQTAACPKNLGVHCRKYAVGDVQNFPSQAMSPSGLKEEQSKLMDFKLGARAKVGDADTQIVECSAEGENARDKYKYRNAIKIWIDTTTLLPAKMEGRSEIDGKTMATMTATYLEWTLDTRVDAKTFALKPPPQTEAIPIDAVALVAEFKANEAAAKQKYQGKLLDVTGKVNFTVPKNKPPTVMLEAGKSPISIPAISCEFDKAPEPQIAKMQPGQTVTIRGRCSNFSEDVVFLKECELLKEPPGPTDAGQSDSDKLQGTWVITATEIAGKTKPEPAGSKITIEKNKIVFKEGRLDDAITFTIDASKTPKQMDWTSAKATEKGIVEVIYELQGDTLKYAHSIQGPKGQRPTSFDSKDAYVVHLKREKVAAQDSNRFAQLGIVFDYPKEWKVKATTDGAEAVNVSNGKGTNVLIQLHPANTDPKALRELMEKRSHTAGKVVNGSRTAVKRKLLGSIREGITMDFDAEANLVVRTELFVFPLPSKKRLACVLYVHVTLYAEAANFDLIANSLAEGEAATDAVIAQVRFSGEKGDDAGWAAPWVGPSTGAVVQKKVAFESGPALHLSNSGYNRRLAEPQKERFVVEQHVQIPNGGGAVAYVRNGEGGRTDGPVWRAADGKFLVMAQDNKWVETPYTVEAGKWHKVVVTIDVTARTWEFSVDGRPFKAPQALQFRSKVDQLDTLRYQCENVPGIYIGAVRILRSAEAAATESADDTAAYNAFKKLGARVTTWPDEKSRKITGVSMLFNKQATDAALKEAGLSKLQSLEDLNLSNTPVTDIGLQELRGLKRLRFLNLNKTKVTDAGLRSLKQHGKLTILELASTGVTDAGMKDLAELGSLTILDLRSTQVQDAGLKDLAKLKNLVELNLGFTKITGDGLKELTGLQNLDGLILDSVAVTDADLKHLGGHKRLKELRLDRTKITDAGLKELSGLQTLQDLDLSSTAITDAGLKEVNKLKNLKGLRLDKTKVTDAGLVELRELNQLEAVWLELTAVTPAGKAALEKALPTAKIYITNK